MIQENKDRNSRHNGVSVARRLADEDDPGEQGSKLVENVPAIAQRKKPTRMIQENKDRNGAQVIDHEDGLGADEDDPGEQGSKHYSMKTSPLGMNETPTRMIQENKD